MKSINEISEIDIFENLHGNIIIVEWPELIMNHLNVKDYYLIELELIRFIKKTFKNVSFKKRKDLMNFNFLDKIIS